MIGQALPLHQSAVSLFSTAFDMSMKAFSGAMQYAEVATNFVIKVYEVLQRDFEIDQMYVDKQIAIIKEQRDGELYKLQVVEAELKVESLKSDQNKDRLMQYGQEIEAGNQKVARYTAQISALNSLLNARELPLKAFEANVRGYLATWQAKEGEYKDIEMRIRGDEAKTRGELAKQDVYKTAASVFETLVNARAKKIEGQIQRNQQIMKEFEIKQNAEVELTKIDALVSQNALDAYKAMAEIYIAESQQRLATAKLDFDEVIANSELEIKEREFEFKREISNLEIEMTRIKAIAEMQLSVAQVHGRNAASAMSVMNTMAELSVTAST
jgi:PIN domain nuclease of toxin-antitoxin system